MELTQDILDAIHAKLSTADLDGMYDSYLDDVYGTVSVVNQPASYVLKTLDPSAYNCGFSEWLDSEISNNYIIQVVDDYYIYDDVQDLIDEMKG